MKPKTKEALKRVKEITRELANAPNASIPYNQLSPEEKKKRRRIRDNHHGVGDPVKMIWLCKCHPPAMGHDFIDNTTVSCKCGVTWRRHQLAPIVCAFHTEAAATWLADPPVSLLPDKWKNNKVGPRGVTLASLGRSQ